MMNGNNDHHKTRKPRSNSRDHQLIRALARALVAEADAAEARENEKKTVKLAEFWKAEWNQERRRALRAEAEAENRNLQKQGCEIHSLTRERLIKALCSLKSDEAGERASAALVAEKQRLMLGKTWNELIVRDRENHDLREDDPVNDRSKKAKTKKTFTDNEDEPDDDNEGIDPDDGGPVA